MRHRKQQESKKRSANLKKKLSKRERAWRKFNFKMVNLCPIAKIVMWRACLRNVTPHGFGNWNAFAALINAALIRTLLRTTDGKAFCCLSINRGNCQATGNRAQFLTRSEWSCCLIGEDCWRIRKRRSRERRFFKKEATEMNEISCCIPVCTATGDIGKRIKLEKVGFSEKAWL